MPVQSTDPLQPGLTLREGEGRGTWILRVRVGGKQAQLNIGHDDTMPVDLAREIVRRGIADARKGVPVDQAWVLKIREEFADRLIQPEPLARPVPWGWIDALDVFLEDLAERGRSSATIAGYKAALRAIEGLDDRLVRDVTLVDMQAALMVAAKKRPGSASRTRDIARTWWRWLATEEVRKMSDVGSDVLAGLAPPPGASRPKLQRVVFSPDIRAVARVVSDCRRGGLHPSIAGAIEVACLTGVKLAKICAARKQDIRMGWWFIPGNLRVSEYCIPLAPRLRLIMDTSGEWCFEGAQPVYEERTHINEVAVATALRRMADFTPSSISLAMMETLSDAGFSGKDIDYLHRRAHEEAVEEMLSAGVRGRMLMAWQKIVEAAI